MYDITTIGSYKLLLLVGESKNSPFLNLPVLPA